LGAAEQVGDGTLAGAGPTDDGNVQGRRRLAIEEWPEDVANDSGGQAQFAGLKGAFGAGELLHGADALGTAMFLQPAEVLGKLARQGTMADAIHDRRPMRKNAWFVPGLPYSTGIESRSECS